MQLDRREFIELIGLSSLGFLAFGCNNKELDTKISRNDLKDYNLIFSGDKTLLVRYDYQDSFTVVQLGTENRSLTESIIYEDDSITLEEGKIKFFEEYNVDYSEPILYTLGNVFYLEDSYSIDEISLAIDKAKENRGKKLIKTK